MYFLIAFSATVLLVLVERRRTLIRLAELMHTKAPISETLLSENKATPETPATHHLNFTTYDQSTLLPSAVEEREVFVKSALAQFQRELLVDLVAAAGYCLLPALIGALEGGEGFKTGLNLGLIASSLFLAFTLIRYFYNRSQFRAIDVSSRLERGLRRVGGFTLTIITTITGGAGTAGLQFVASLSKPVFMIIWLIFMLFACFGEFSSAAVGMPLAALLHFALVVAFVQYNRHVQGVRLVVLRVFGLDSNAIFLFDGVLSFWRNFGHFYTVVDPSHWRHSNKLFSWSTFWTLAVAAIIWALVLAQSAAWCATAVATSVVAILMVGYVWLMRRRLENSFIQSKMHLIRQMARFEKYPRNLDSKFRHLEARCYDDTWKLAVAEFVDQANAVVIMDLRGYTAERKGCEYEVNFLLDRVPIERIVFLIDKDSHQEAIMQLILDCWKDLDRSSPNLANEASEVIVFVAGNKNEEDVQGVLDLLIHATQTDTSEPLARRTSH